MVILNWLMWLMFSSSLIISLITMVVAYGIKYIPMFATFLPLEISLSLTFFIWGINSRVDPGSANSKRDIYYSIIFGGILIGFAYFRIY